MTDETAWMNSLAAKTGKTIDEWKAIAQATGLTRHADLVARLKADHGLTHGYANTIALKARGADAGSMEADDLMAQMFAGPKAAIRPVYDAVMARVTALGDDVEHAPKKGYTSLRRKKQFALVQPSTKDRLDLGLSLKGVEPSGRLEAAGSWNAMVSHRVRLASESEVDDEVAGWLRDAYDRAG